ncbi:L-threonylcarbamoyladenylate synthase [Bifidobacterium gallicum]|uniref:L-threonylcarbamoyladenylate synthase n=1 Tax=Bifidobacterium gallicum DSM 20093 = LMG 11596 TaxID=561180 RepID=D1NUW2_9BIFI|nr:L-threonylcarbamoyladenylate synthase [Bifidobacterium gallicum]EFA22613.1 Sua5/YciO/YrdC/YwlC family protein [Bifidobacterium gallicum DSM 20093 = LMG 11596]KFI59591.1 translation factor Sua5 [Bifidobacterium gallicum DSM 20093 = LMG 11596]
MVQILPINEESLTLVADVVSRGGIVVVPTDTVYGVACNPHDEQAIARIFAVKQRPATKSLQILMADVQALDELGLALPTPLDRLGERFLPGAFSPIAVMVHDRGLKTLKQTSDGVLTQGVRVPDSDACRAILRVTGPLACSSANKSGQQSAHSVQEAVAAFGDEVDLYVDGGPTVSHVASTVVEADPNDADGIRIIREGRLDEASVRAALR